MGKIGKNPVGDFKNEDRLLSDDEKELVGVLANYYEAIEDLRQRQKALEEQVGALVAAFGASMRVVKH